MPQLESASQSVMEVLGTSGIVRSLLESLPSIPAWMELLGGGLLAIGVPLFILELWRLWRRGELGWERIKGMLTSAFCLVPATIVQALGVGLLIVVYFSVSALSPWVIPTTPLTALLCLLAVDFLYYWEHRLGHEVNVLWALYHSVHHSANHYDQTIGLRVSFIDFFFSPLMYLPLVLVGFDPLLVFAAFGVVLAWQQWLHTELVGRLGWLEGILNTPSNHRVHHGRNEEYLDKNYGGILIVWDRLFGTYEPEVAEVSFGLVERLESHDPVDVHTHSARKLWRKLREVKTWRERLKLILSNPPF